jgi:hypothetical protein
MNDFCACFFTLPLAQGVPDISSVEAGFVKNWMMMLGFALMLGLQVWQGVRGSQVQRRDVSGTLTTVPVKQHADQSEVDELKEEVQELKEESRAQHMQAATAGHQRVMALSEVIDTRTGEIEQKLEVSMKEVLLRMDEGFKDLSEKLAAVSIQGARHDATLPHLSERITALTDRYNEEVPSIHRRIDDLTKAMASKTR